MIGMHQQSAASCLLKLQMVLIVLVWCISVHILFYVFSLQFPKFSLFSFSDRLLKFFFFITNIELNLHDTGFQCSFQIINCVYHSTCLMKIDKYNTDYAQKCIFRIQKKTCHSRIRIQKVAVQADSELTVLLRFSMSNNNHVCVFT